MSELAISIENLSKKYEIGQIRKRQNLSEQIAGFFKGPISRFWKSQEEEILWALRDISFQVKHGEVLGIIGRNGAGKSTLLKILSRITYPTEGQAVLHGRVASLLEVGTGFHQELTGRENVYLNGAILGMFKSEIDRKFDEIVAFSEVERFIDTPVKHYSSGMKLRLAFAVAAHLEPEIMLVDEALAVGDAAFQKKCLGKMGSVAQQGRTVLFVSHDMAAIHALCDRGVLLEQGRVVVDDRVGIAIENYLKLNLTTGQSAWSNPGVPSDSEVILHEVWVHDSEGKVRHEYSDVEDVFIGVRYELQKRLTGMRLKIRLLSDRGTTIITTSDISATSETRIEGEYVSTCRIPGRILNRGQYTVVVFAAIPRRKELVAPREYVSFSIERHETKGSSVQEKLIGVLNPSIASWTVSEAQVLTKNER